MVLGPNEAGRYLKKTLDCFKQLCDDVVVATCNATAKEMDLLDKYDFRHYPDNREWGKFQPYIKTDLLKIILKLGADWILPLDADEEIIVNRKELEGLTVNRESCYFYIVNLWNDGQHYSKTLSFWNVRFYKADASKGTQFLKKPLHCGNAPPYFYVKKPKESYVPFYLKHRGLLDPVNRAEKARRYEIYDPFAIHKGRDYYDALVVNGSGTELNYNQLKKQLYDYCEKLRK